MELKPHMPIYAAIKEHLKRQIDTGELADGARVPSEQQLATELGVSRGQTRQALRDLEMEGYLIRTPGRGTFVAPRSRRVRARGDDGPPSLMMAYQEGPIQSRYAREVIQGFIDTAHATGYQPTFYYLSHNKRAELDFLRRMPSTGVQGLALWPYYFKPAEADSPLISGEAEIVRALREQGYPCVLFDRAVEGVDTDFVGTDNRGAFRSLTAAVIAEGHSEIAYLARDFTDSVMADRLAGYRDALEAAGLSYRETRAIGAGGYDSEEGPVSAAEALLRMRPRITALVASDDLTLTAVLPGLAPGGLTPPDTLRVATMNDGHFPHLDPRPWLTIVQDGRRVGEEAVRLLIDRIGAPGKARRSVLVPALQEGGSPLDGLAEAHGVEPTSGA